MSLRPVTLFAVVLVGCGSAPSDVDPVAAPDFVASESQGGSSGGDTVHWDPERAEQVLDATWYGDVLVSNDAVLLDGLPGFEGFDPIDSGVVLRFADPSTVRIREGDVLVSGLDGGLLARVETVSVGAEMRVITSPARLTDVIYHALTAERIPLTLEPGALPAGALRDASTFDFSGTPLFSISGGGGNASAEIETGVVTLDPTLDFGLNIDWFDWNRPWPKLEKASLGVMLDASLDLVVHAEADGAFDRDGTRDLFAFSKPFAFQVGPVPVTGAVEFDVDLELAVVELEGDGSEVNGVSVLEGGGGDAFSIDERPVGRREVT
jgi:hypothetical protein